MSTDRLEWNLSSANNASNSLGMTQVYIFLTGLSSVLQQLEDPASGWDQIVFQALNGAHWRLSKTVDDLERHRSQLSSRERVLWEAFINSTRRDWAATEMWTFLKTTGNNLASINRRSGLHVAEGSWCGSCFALLSWCARHVCKTTSLQKPVVHLTKSGDSPWSNNNLRES